MPLAESLTLPRTLPTRQAKLLATPLRRQAKLLAKPLPRLAMLLQALRPMQVRLLAKLLRRPLAVTKHSIGDPKGSPQAVPLRWGGFFVP